MAASGASKRPARKPAPKKKPSREGKPSAKKLKPLRSLTREQWEAVGRKAFDRFGEVGLTDRAAALAYYGFLSLFPALIVAVALLALFGSYPETYRSIIDALHEAAPGEVADTIDSALKNVLRGRGAEGLLGFGLLFAFITASGAIGAVDPRARGDQRDQRVSQLRAQQPDAAVADGDADGADAGRGGGAADRRPPVRLDRGFGGPRRHAAATLVQLLRYPVGFAALLLALLLLYALGPAGTRRRLVEHLPGALLATVLWLLASMAFSFYVDNFGSYDKTYGTLGSRDRAAHLDLRRRGGDAAGSAREQGADPGAVGPGAAAILPP